MLPTALLPAQPRAGRPSLFESRPVLWGLVAVGAAGAFGAQAFVPVLRDLHLPDTDDAMRLVQVRDFLAGQSWFDVGQHRLLPPAGASMHWSRLVDLPVAALLLLLRPLAGGQAEALAAALWPPLLFCLYGACLLGGARRLFGARAALLALFLATQAALVTGLFAPGRIDHHNVQICAVLALALRLMGPAPGWRDGAAAGALAALSLAVGLETLPFIAAAGLLVCGSWILSGARALGAFAGFAAALAAGSLGLFALTTAPAQWGAPACDALSPPWLWIAACAGATGLAAASLGGRLPTRAGRLAVAALGAALMAAGFALVAPACLGGPFAGMPESVRQGWLAKVSEMLPIWRHLAEMPGPALSAYGPELVGALVATSLARRGPAGERRAWTVLAGAFWLGTLLGTLQFRGLYVASGFVALAGGAVFDRVLGLLRAPEADPRARAALLAAGLGLIGKVWLVAAALPALAGLTAPPPGEGGWGACTTRDAAAALAAAPPGTVLAPVDLGPFLLLHTPHGVVAAPYHRAGEGIAAALDAFRDEAALRRVAAERRAAYIAICPPGEDEEGGPPLVRDLARGKVAPSWLEPIPMPHAALKAWRLRPTP
ncbi:conserved hypothetical protein [Methylobacterium sp. 4-46]|uniref:hypothetical protein n=1 Tax=unclassified Methylobacterium TaxID=2615210 RepID=UPI000152D9CF|nr:MULTISPECIES: hypothetical protein [Methylobacterium]ACA16696.1 conserved hypothetical protein [Methylobacterium sp. 4-46]WFT82396.1 hypothetical protein QA634_11325 [Methylobacterium nodulans]